MPYGESKQALSLGSTLTRDLSSLDANPANISLNKDFFIQTTSVYQNSIQGFEAGIIDNTNSELGGGIKFRQINGDTRRFTFGLSELFTPELAFGVAADYFWLNDSAFSSKKPIKKMGFRAGLNYSVSDYILVTLTSQGYNSPIEPITHTLGLRLYQLRFWDLATEVQLDKLGVRKTAVLGRLYLFSQKFTGTTSYAYNSVSQSNELAFGGILRVEKVSLGYSFQLKTLEHNAWLAVSVPTSAL